MKKIDHYKIGRWMLGVDLIVSAGIAVFSISTAISTFFGGLIFSLYYFMRNDRFVLKCNSCTAGKLLDDDATL